MARIGMHTQRHLTARLRSKQPGCLPPRGMTSQPEPESGSTMLFAPGTGLARPGKLVISGLPPG